MYKYTIFIFVFLCCCILNAQEENSLCSPQENILLIPNPDNLPIVTDNNDGTVTLTFSDQSITDIFANHTIYDFYQSFPDFSGNLLNYYTIDFQSRDLIIDLTANVPEDYLYVDYNYNSYTEVITSAIEPEVINTLDGTDYKVTKFLSTSDADPCFGCPLIDVSSEFNFEVSFNYDAARDLLIVENTEPTSCGNSMSIALAGGNPSIFSSAQYDLQLWETDPGVKTESSFSQYCHFLEILIFSMFDISCYNQNYGNIEITIDDVEETITLERPNQIFGYDSIEFSRVSLSVEEERFTRLKPYQQEGNPYLLVSNLENQAIAVDIFNSIGQAVLSTDKFENNTIDLSKYSKGLYFIRLSTSNNQQRVFKYILN